MGKYFYKKANQMAGYPTSDTRGQDTLASTKELLNKEPVMSTKPPKPIKTKRLEAFLPKAKNQLKAPKMSKIAKKLNPVSESYKYFRFVKKQTHDQSRINAAKARESGVYPDWVMNKMKKNLEETKKPKAPKQLSLFSKKASLVKLGFKKNYFSHTTSKNALDSILSSGKILTGKSLGELRKSLRNIDDMTPDELNEYVSTGKNRIYTSGKKFRSILMRKPANKASHLSRESLFKGDIVLDPSKTVVAVPSNRVTRYKKKFPKYNFISSEGVNPKSLRMYKQNKKWQAGGDFDDLHQMFKNY